MANIYRIYVSFSIDGGDTWEGMDEVSDSSETDDQTIPTTREQVCCESNHDRHMDVLYTDADAIIRFATAAMPPVPLQPHINKLNRTRTTGNEL